MKKIILFLGIIAFSGPLFAQSWLELGTGINALNANDNIYSICIDHSGKLYAGGAFYGPDSLSYVAQWDGTNWTKLGSIYESDTASINYILSLCLDDSGYLYAAGFFTNVYWHEYVAKWDGTSWQELGTGGTTGLMIYNSIQSICTDKFGNVYAAADYYDFGSVPRTGVLKWNGGSWSELGSGSVGLNANYEIYSICADSFGNVYAAGGFDDSTGKCYVAKWNGSSWSELGQGFEGLGASIKTMCLDGSGNVYVGGSFYDTVTNLPFIGKWNGLAWTKLETGIDPSANILTICTDNSGNVYAAGLIINSGYSYVIKWDGITWGYFCTGVSDSEGTGNRIHTICAQNTGEIYAAGSFYDVNSKYYVATNNTNVGISQPINNENEITIYPNPNQGVFTLLVSSTIDEKVTVTVTNMVGEKVKEFTTVTDIAADIILNQPAGIYFLSATTVHNKYLAKIIIE